MSPPSDHIELLSHRDSRLCHGFNRKRLNGDSPHPTELNSTSFSSGVRNSFSCLLFRLSISIVSVRKLHKHFLYVTLLPGPLFIEGRNASEIVIPELGFTQVTHSNHDLCRHTRFGSQSRWRPAITVPTYRDNTVHSISPSAATADHQNTMRDYLSPFSRGRCSRMLSKVMPHDFRSVSGSLVTRTFPVGMCGTNTIHTQLSSHSNCDWQSQHLSSNCDPRIVPPQ